MAVLVNSVPCIVYEDEHLLLVNKPTGWNTHSPSPHAGEGIYEWLRNREPRWATLAIIHRLDKDTSGLLLFTKTQAANRSLTAQFASRSVLKKYVFLTHLPPDREKFTVKSRLVRAGEKYFSRPIVAGCEVAETEFRLLGRHGKFYSIEARPLTGRTHQIRVHAADQRIPVLGDILYGGTPAARMCLHAAELSLKHPVSGEPLEFIAEPDFESATAEQLRRAIINSDTNAFRIIHGTSDRQPGLYVERWGDYLLAQREETLSQNHLNLLKHLAERQQLRGAYFKLLKKGVAAASLEETAPQHLFGSEAPDPFLIRENGVSYEISFRQGYSVGLFLDQRDNRRRLLTHYLGLEFTAFGGGLKGKAVLNCFAYTCGFSVSAGLAGATTVSLDLSKKYLDWGKRNFTANKLDPNAHDFIFGDVFAWASRLAKKGRKFDLILLDPPTFSRSKEGAFRAEKDFGKLVQAVLPLLLPDGILFCSTNAQKLDPENFLAVIKQSVEQGGRRVAEQLYAPQPPDFPVSKAEPAYLKTVWLRIN
jgi:23S rRNA (cytosine1962-C5)-methyltransferase